MALHFFVTRKCLQNSRLSFPTVEDGFGNGARIGTAQVTIRRARLTIQRDRKRALSASYAVAVGTMLRRFAVPGTARGSLCPSSTAPSGFASPSSSCLPALSAIAVQKRLDIRVSSTECPRGSGRFGSRQVLRHDHGIFLGLRIVALAEADGLEAFGLVELARAVIGLTHFQYGRRGALLNGRVE